MTYRSPLFDRQSLLRQHRSAFRYRSLAFLLVVLLVLPSVAFSQSAGDFRSKRNGRWDRTNTWEEYNGSSWVNANNIPDWRDGTITIRSGDSVQANDGQQYDQVVVESGATLTITDAFGVIDGPGTDFAVSGTLLIEDDLIVEDGASVVFDGNASVTLERRNTFEVADGSSVSFSNSATFVVDGDIELGDTGSMTFEDNVDVSIGRRGSVVVENTASVSLTGNATLSLESDLTVDDSATFTIGPSAVLTNANRGEIDISGSGTLSVSGTLVNQSDIVGGGVFEFESGSTYEHDQDGGDFPPSSGTTWDSGSTAMVTGADRNAPDNLDATFGTFIWDSPGQSRDIDFEGSIEGVSGDFIINETGSGDLIWDGRGGGSTLSIGGDFNLNDGTFIVSEGNTSSIEVAGDLTTASGTTLQLEDRNGNGTVVVQGDLLATGDITTDGGGTGTLEIAGAGAHDLALTGSLTGDIDLVLTGPGSTTALSDLVIPGSITETGGGLDMGENAISVENDLNISTSLTNVDSITFTGDEASTLTLPAGSQTISGLTIDKPGSGLTLGSNVNVTGYVVVTDGSFDEGGFELILEEGASFYSDQPITGTVTISRTYSQSTDGWRMIASPVEGVSFSDLNTAFYTQGADWASNTIGTANLQAFNFAGQDWSPLGGADSQFSTGEGYILYAFAEDDTGAPRLPTTWTVTGNPGTLSAQSLSWSGDATSSWNLVGNPSTMNLDWDLTDAASTGIASSYATWDPSGTEGGGTTGYKYYDAASGIGSAGRYIAPFTAYMVQATGATASLQPTSSPEAATQTAQQFGKTGSIAPHLRLSVEGESLAEPETILSFGAEATDDSHAFDVVRLVPLSTQYVSLWSAAGDRRLAFDGRTMESGREVYDLVFATTRNGMYTLKAADISGIPSHWTARLVDLSTGNELDLKSGASLTFQTRDRDVVTADSRLSDDRTPRFRVIVEDPDRAMDDDTSVTVSGEEAVLSQNYPNPFNPVTTIRFSLPESAPVRLEVFDMLGRRVAILADGVMTPGWHEARFDGSTLSSGMYLYRLSIAAQTHTRSMLLLR